MVILPWWSPDRRLPPSPGTVALQGPPDEAGPPNGYYIINDNPRLRRLPVAGVLV